MIRGRRQRGRAGLAYVVLAAVAACGGRTSPPPQPGQMRGVPPDLRGRGVLLLPVQHVLGVRGDADTELVFTLEDRARTADMGGKATTQEFTEALVRALR